MPWTYGDAPATVPRDAVRMELGDINASDPTPLTDASIAYYLTQEGDNVLRAAARGAGVLASYYGRQTDYSMGGLSQSASQRAAYFKALATTLLRRAMEASGAEVFTGGLTISGKETLDEDTDAIQPNFRVGGDDFPSSNVDPRRDNT